MFCKGFGKEAQGTIEYLVILAVIVIVSLIVVSLIINSAAPAEGISSSIGKVAGWSNTLAVTETSINPDGNFLVRLSNNTGSPLTITNVRVGDVNVDYSEDLFLGSQQNFVLSSDVVCSLGQTIVSDLLVTYVTEHGLVKTETFPANIAFNCDDYVVTLAANKCPDVGESSCEYIGNATIDEVKTGRTFYSNSSDLLTGTLVVPDPVELHSGQTTCYNADNNPDSCPPSTGPGNQDANWDGTPKSYTPNGCGGGTVLDNHTGLCWQKDHKNDCTPLKWENALSYCSTLANGSGGLTDGSSAGDWRVPSYVELATLPDMNYPSSSYLNSVFTQTGWNSTCHGYWSSTTVPSSTSDAYYLYSYDGIIYYGGKTIGFSYGVRCVRSE